MVLTRQIPVILLAIFTTLNASCSKLPTPATNAASDSEPVSPLTRSSGTGTGSAADAVPASRVGEKAIAKGSTPPSLYSGKPAPPLVVQKWVKGEPVAKFQPGHVYVIEFWATWCGPCVKAMPHLTELATRHRGKVTIIGLNVSEHDGDGLVGKIEKFVAEQGDKIGYPIAIDTAAGGMQQTWLDAAGLDGIPQSFVIDGTGKIAWIGHPEQLGEVLDAVLAGKPVTTPEGEDDLVMKEIIAKVGPMQKALDKKDFATAMKYVEELINMPAGGFQFAPLKFQILADSVGPAKAYDYAKEMLAGKPPESKEGRHWSLLTISDIIMSEQMQERDYQLALLLIQESLKNTMDAENGYAQSILARATYLSGKKDEGLKIAVNARKLIEKDVNMPEEMKKQCLNQLAELK